LLRRNQRSGSRGPMKICARLRDFPDTRDFPGLTAISWRAYVLCNVVTLLKEVHGCGRHSSCALGCREPHAASGILLQLDGGGLRAAAGSLHVAAFPSSVRLLMALADCPRWFTEVPGAEVCPQSREKFPFMTVFRSILRIAKWSVRSQDPADGRGTVGQVYLRPRTPVTAPLAAIAPRTEREAAGERSRSLKFGECKA
jgi:hypothetical protein